MTEETKQEGQETQEKKPIPKPEDIPMADRFATLMIVWTKAGQILTAYPQENHVATKMLATALQAVAEDSLARFQHQQEMMARLQALENEKNEKKIVPASADQLPAFDPRLLKKPH